MCCIVLKHYYLCVVVGIKPVKPHLKFLNYSKSNIDLRTPLQRRGIRGEVV